MSDPSNPPATPDDDEETSDTGGDSDPSTNEGFEPSDQAADDDASA